MHVLVTGGAGDIGSVIAARLLARGHAVTVYDDLSRGHRAAVPAGASLVQGDIRDQSRVQGALLDSRCDAIVHMAALAEVGESVEQPERYHDVNVNGTAAVIAAAKAAAVGRLVFSSTAAVYGEPRRVPIDEDDELAPTNPYGASKLAGERLLEQARDAGDLAFTALRYFNACGADGPGGEDHDPESHLIPLALSAARDGAALRVFGDDYPTPDGTCVRDYVHVADLSDAHILALEALPAWSCAVRWRGGAPGTRRRSWRAAGGRRRAWAGARGAAWRTPSAMRGPGCKRIQGATQTDERSRRESRAGPPGWQRRPRRPAPALVILR